MRPNTNQPSNVLTGDYYYVDSLPFVHKTEAFVCASKMKRKVSWCYHDEVYSSYDWKKPIDVPLAELYKKRAQQIRDKYDYVSLFFSGGVDSANILHSFIDNDIHLDEVVMHYPAKIESKVDMVDKTGYNQTGEILFAALPHLREYLKTTKTIVRTIDMNAATDMFLADPKLVSEFYHLQFLGPQMLARKAILFMDSVWNNLYNAGKRVAHVNGSDKPIINILGNDRYHFQFSDWVRPYVVDYYGSSEYAQRMRLYQHHEPFYWSPDMPELVIKQCQMMKNICMRDQKFKAMFTDCYNSLGDRFTDTIIPYIYPPHVNSIRKKFAVSKSPIEVYSWWFTQTSTSKSIGTFQGIQKFLKDNIDDRFFSTNKKDFLHYRSRPYEL